MEKPFRWGILSDAGINGAVVPGIAGAPGSELAAIASRSLERARAAAARWEAPAAYGSYEDLLADPEIDAVYIPLPNHLHATWTIRALEAGKHVLCEKPLALTIEEVDAIAAAADRTGLVVVEAFMYRYAPRWLRAVDLVRAGALGDVRVVRVGHSFLATGDTSENVRFSFSAPDGGGVLWDMGCYAVDMSRGLFGSEPEEVVGFASTRPGAKAETSVSALLRFADGRVAPIFSSFDYPSPYTQVEVVGTQGWLGLPTAAGRTSATTLLWRGQDKGEKVGAVEPVEERFDPIDPYSLEVAHLADVARGRVEPAWTLDYSRSNTAALQALHASLRDHVAVAPRP